MDFDRVDIGAQVVAGHTGRRFDAQDVFGGEALAGLQPLPDGGLGDAANGRHRLLAASSFDRVFERFERGGI